MSTDDPRDVAFDHSAPMPERFDAQSELSKAHKPSISDLIPREDLMPVIDYINGNLAEQELYKGGDNVIWLNDHVKGKGKESKKPAGKQGMQSVWLDDYQIFVRGEWYEKPSPIGFDGLRQMVDQTPVLAAVILTRQRQVRRFCQVSEDSGPGFEIRHVDRDHQLTADEQDSVKLLQRFVSNCGWEFSPRRRKALRRDNFSQFTAKYVRDSLTMDAAPIETELKRDRALGIDGFYAVDGATIRLVTEDGYEGDDQIFAVQVVQGQVRAAYSFEDLIYEPRNPRTEVTLAGYGMGETELLIRVVTGFLNALTYNIKGFDENSIPKGLLQLTGEYSKEDLASFKRYWNAMVKGVNNAWALPVLANRDPQGGAKFERFGIEFDEMYFSKWMTFLTSIICAVYGMSPDEINFESFAAAKSSLSGNDTEEKLADSKDKGLRPLLTHLESTVSDFIIQDFSDKYCFRWVGLDREDEERDWEAKKLILSLDELRAEKGYEKWPDGKLGGAPINASLLSAWQAENQENQQDFGTVPEGGEGPEGGQDNEGQEADGADGSPGGGSDGNTQEGDFGGDTREGDFGKSLPVIYDLGLDL